MEFSDLQSFASGTLKAYTMFLESILPVYQKVQTETFSLLMQLDPTVRLILIGLSLLFILVASFRTARYVLAFIFSVFVLAMEVALFAVALGMLYVHKDTVLEKIQNVLNKH